MTELKVIPNNEAWSEEAILRYVQGLPRKEATIHKVAGYVGWKPHKIDKLLRKWATDGLIERRVTTRGSGKKRGNRKRENGFAGVVSVSDLPPAVTIEQQPGRELTPLPPPVATAMEPRTLVLAPETHARAPFSWAYAFYGLLIMAMAFGLAAVSIKLNIEYAGSLSRTPEASLLLKAMGGLFELGTLVLLTAVRMLWRTKEYKQAIVTCAAWLLCAGFTSFTACGFAKGNFGDTEFARRQDINDRATFEKTIADDGQQLLDITEKRSQGEINQAIKDALAQLPGSVLRSTSNCEKTPEREISKMYCRPVSKQKDALEAALRRDTLNKDIANAEEKKKNLAPYSVADPFAEMARTLSNNLVSVEQWQNIRIILLMLTPLIGACLMSTGYALWENRRPRTHVSEISS